MISTLKKKLNKKGFTLAELLVVVAIIAVLVAIAIPVFGSAVGKAEHSANLANVRATYAEEMVKEMTANGYKGGTIQIKTANVAASVPSSCTINFTSGTGTTEGKIEVKTGSYTDEFVVDADVTFDASTKTGTKGTT